MVRIGIGVATITRIEETYAPAFAASTFFPAWDPSVLERHSGWMIPDHYEAATGFLKLSVHSWLIEVGGRRILIDTCVGNEKERPARPMWHRMQTAYLDRLTRAGVDPEDIDLVMCTHLHQDHVGWNTRLVDGRWRPTFPNARYLLSRIEYEGSLKREQDPRTAPANLGSFRDSIVPVVEEGLADIVDAPLRLDEFLSIEPGPGHTPGHIVIHLESGGERGVFPGDIIHSAIQLYRPEWNCFVCIDAEQARATRRRVLDECADSQSLLMPTHFGAPFACHVEREGDAFRPRFLASDPRARTTQ